jgi:hypothetical protein
MNIFIFSWNTQSLRISESMTRTSEEEKSQSLISRHWFGCESPDFLPELMKTYIFPEGKANGAYHLLVFALQEDAKPGSYLMSHAIPFELGNRYRLICRERMMGIGKTTIDSLKEEYSCKARGLRIGIWAREDWASNVTLEKTIEIPIPGQNQLTRGKGALVACIQVANHGRIAFANCHLPFESTTIGTTNEHRWKTGVEYQNWCMNLVLRTCVHQLSPDLLWVVGDLNYRLLNPDAASTHADARAMWIKLTTSIEDRREIYRTCDELKLSMDMRLVPPMKEGPDESGPVHFLPTNKLRNSRASGDTSEIAYKFGKRNQRHSSWCDRILFCNRNQWLLFYGDEFVVSQPPPASVSFLSAPVQKNIEAKCVLYDRFESGILMTHSDHAAVLGGFTVSTP